MMRPSRVSGLGVDADDYNSPRERTTGGNTLARIDSDILGQEDDGRWWADIESMPGVMAYGATREAAVAAVRALALRVAADSIDHGEPVPEPFARVFLVS